MNFMNNIKVAYKLLILAVISDIGMAIISFFGFTALEKAQNDMTHLYNVNVTGLVHLGNARQGMRSAQTMTVIMTTVKDDPARMKELQGKYDDAIKTTDENLEERIVASLQMAGEHEKEISDKIRQHNTIYKNKTEAMSQYFAKWLKEQFS